MELAVAIGALTIGWLLYHYLTTWMKNRTQGDEVAGKEGARVAIVVRQRLLGVFFLGLLPVLAMQVCCVDRWQAYGLAWGRYATTWPYILVAAVLIVILIAAQAGSQKNLSRNPEIRLQSWPPRVVLGSGLSLLAYLLAYELLFRGLLWHASLLYLDLPAAIVLNVSLYALVHVPKNPAEVIGAVPFGIVLCLLTYHSGSILPAIFLHFLLAISNEWISLYKHPDMKIKWK